MKKILICGDSFAVDYSKFSNDLSGWSTLLANDDYAVTNLAQAGVSEYKILKQLESTNLKKFDAVIVCHTSPNRLYIRNHPVYNNNKLHKNSDLIYSDVEWHLKQNPNNKILATAKNYFDNIYDQEHQEDVYRLIQLQIENMLLNFTKLHLTPLYDNNNSQLLDTINLKKLFKVKPGSANHYSDQDNNTIYILIKQWINNNV
jgi:hypothetical protein